MVKLFCDGCGVEIERNYVDERLKRCATSGLKMIAVEVMVAVENTWNAGQVCKACVLRVVNEP